MTAPSAKKSLLHAAAWPSSFSGRNASKAGCPAAVLHVRTHIIWTLFVQFSVFQKYLFLVFLVLEFTGYADGRDNLTVEFI